MSQTHTPPVDLGFLSSLGFGPDSPLMNEPRLLVDGRFLGAVLVELEDELGEERANAVFYQIGLFHGLRDASRLVTQNFDSGAIFEDATHPEATPLAIALGPKLGSQNPPGATPGAIELSGEWPEGYEAHVRMGKLGPDAIPSCWLSAGYTAGWLSGSFDGDMVVIETECCARGDESCRFLSLEAESYRTSTDIPNAAMTDSASFDAFRQAASTHHLITPHAQEGPLDLGEPAVHVWGPVMVLPFTDVEQALRTVEMLGREADTTEIRAVVLDLRSSPIDEGYGAAGLEQVLEYIETWGADAILTGVCDLSENVVAGLETERLLIRKDLSQAIAIAFQIAEVQRHLL